MLNDSEVYVDPEEDEVFFGYVSEKEKTVWAKLVKHEGPVRMDIEKFTKVLSDCVGHNEDNIIVGDKLMSEQTNKFSSTVCRDVFSNSKMDSVTPKGLNEFVLEDDVSNKIISNNTSVELDHNYSTPMKHKIDKSILKTPKSIVKADKDGGFLKVLSEIALVKAEAEGDKKIVRAKEEEDKENVISVPDIKITEATPQKANIFSPPKSISKEMRRFRIIYNSPPNEDNLNLNTKSCTEIFESEQNLKNKALNEATEKCLVNSKKKSLDLIDFKDVTEPVKSFLQETNETKNGIQYTKSMSDRSHSCQSGGTISEEKNVDYETAAVPDSSESARGELVKKTFTEVDLSLAQPILESGKLQKGLRFSKDARKIVEVLKKSSVDDTLNFTIPEINVEEEENSFLSPEPVSAFDETVVPNENIEIQTPGKSIPKTVSPPPSIDPPPRVISRSTDKPLEKPKTIEKDRRNLTPSGSQSRSGPIKYFSERRLCDENGKIESKNGCGRRLPFEKKSSVVEKVRGGQGDSKTAPSSRIPVFGTKTSKITTSERTTRTLPGKVTPSKSPLIRTLKNPKFNHIESPINAYIHSKPTSLVLNIKPEAKKDSLTKVWKTQTEGSVKKVEEKAQKTQNSGNGPGVRLPFVEYKSATPYKIEKRPESRLPRLAPTVLKLIGSHSPKVLKHEGRFYVTSPREQFPAENGTIVANPNEVSVVVSQPAQKSNTIK